MVKLNRTIPRKSVEETLEQKASDEIEHRFSAEKGKNLSFFLAETKGFKGLFEERIKRW